MLFGLFPNSRGRLEWQHVKAWVSDEDHPALKGRIALDRGTGVLEYPTPEQFVRIAKQEKIPDADVQAAFGHLIPQKVAKGTRSSRRPRGVNRNARTFHEVIVRSRVRVRRDKWNTEWSETFAAKAPAGALRAARKFVNDTVVDETVSVLWSPPGVPSVRYLDLYAPGAAP